MKTPHTRPLLFILAGFVLWYLSVFFPGTIIRYQIIVEPNQANGLSAPQVTVSEGYANIFDATRDGRGVFPCDIGVRWYAPELSFTWFYTAWQILGRALVIIGFGMGIIYAIERKIPLGLFFISLVLLAAIPIAIMESLPTPETIWCDQSTYYKAISFTPFWPVALTWVTSASFGLYGMRLYQKLNPKNTSPTENKEN